MASPLPSDALTRRVDAPARMSMRGQSKSSDVEAGDAAAAWVAALDCEPPPNSELTRSPNGTEPDDDEVVPSDLEPVRPLVLQPAISSANVSSAPAPAAQRPAFTRSGVVEFIDPAEIPAPTVL